MISSNTKVNNFLVGIQSTFPDSFKTPSSPNAVIGDLVACLPNSKRFPIKAFGNDNILQKDM